MRRASRATMMTGVMGLVLGAVLAPFGCGSGISPGASCDPKGDQACADNKEMVCGENSTWQIAEDCSAHGTTCVEKSGGDVDCE